MKASSSLEGRCHGIVAGDQAGSIRGRIDLWNGKGSSLGHLVFVEDVVPPASVDSPPTLYFPIDCFADMVDMLRNESRVYLTFDAPRPRLSPPGGTHRRRRTGPVRAVSVQTR